jgi:zinc/manganese transport system substrate-binding protein
VARPTCSPLRRSSAWISWALAKPGRLASAAVADYLLQAAGADNLTPWAFQADIMNGTDPSPQDVAIERSLFTQHKVKVFLYNQQVTDSLTESFITLARANGVPVVGVYETMPVPGYDYQSWMLAEVQDLQKAVADKTSSEHL